MMRSKNSDLKKVKALSQVILDQRSDVEQFFLEALSQIKEEIKKKLAAERKHRRLTGQPANNVMAATQHAEGGMANTSASQQIGDD
jgi:hypothetical protein